MILIALTLLAAPADARDRDGDGYPAALDCNDSDPTAHPGRKVPLLTFGACVDHEDRLWMDLDKDVVYFTHSPGYPVMGAHSQCPSTLVLVNGQQLDVMWDNQGLSSEHYIELPDGDYDLRLEPVSARGSLVIEQDPAEENGHVGVVRMHDPGNGPDWVEFVLYGVCETPEPYSPAPRQRAR